MQSPYSRRTYSNTSASERLITASAHDIIRRLDEVRRYATSYRDFASVVARVVKLRDFPYIATLRSGHLINLQSSIAALLHSYAGLRAPGQDVSVLPDFVYDHGSWEFDLMTRSGKHHVKLTGIDRNGDPTLFFTDEYHFLPCEGRTVVDIGANIGDSAIYFICRGAKRVYAFEPYPTTFRIAKENISENGFSDKVFLERIAIGSCRMTINLPRDEVEGTTSQTRNVDSGIGTKQLTLQDLVELFPVQDAVLKMDCEGAEYDIVDGASRSSLREFSHILIEYHYGCRELAGILKRAGFEVRTSRPRLLSHRLSGKPNMYLGHLEAVRQGEKE